MVLLSFGRIGVRAARLPFAILPLFCLLRQLGCVRRFVGVRYVALRICESYTPKTIAESSIVGHLSCLHNEVLAKPVGVLWTGANAHWW